MGELDAGLTRQAREHYSTRVPIIFMTEFNGTGGGQQAMAAGADDYVAKPFRLAELIARIRARLRIVDTKAGSSAGTIPTNDTT